MLDVLGVPHDVDQPELPPEVVLTRADRYRANVDWTRTHFAPRGSSGASPAAPAATPSCPSDPGLDSLGVTRVLFLRPASAGHLRM